MGAHKKRLCAIRTDVAYDGGSETLRVHVHEVEGLSERKFGKPQLYVKLYLSPDPKKMTKVRLPFLLRARVGAALHRDDLPLLLLHPLPSPRSSLPPLPFPLLAVLTTAPRSGREWQRKTAVVKDTSAPVFDENFTFPVSAADVAQRTLRMALWEHGALGNHVLGEVGSTPQPCARGFWPPH